MIPTILTFISLSSFISNTNVSNVESVIRNEVSGQNASVKSEVTNVVNQNVTRVESNQPGEIKVEVKDDQVKIETSPEITPTITTYKLEELTITPEPTMAEEREQIEQKVNGIFSFVDDLFKKISQLFVFGS